MNSKALQIKLGALAIGVLVAIGTSGYIGYSVLTTWKAVAINPMVMAAVWGAFTLLMAVFAMALAMVVRTAVLVVIAAALRGEHAFYWDYGTHTARRYSEWSYDRYGVFQMGVRIGRLQVVLYGMPRSLPGAVQA
jgi:hypothetical protein